MSDQGFIDQGSIKQEAHQLVWQAKHRATQIRPKGGIFVRFANFDKSRLEVTGDVISGRTMGQDVSDNHVKFIGPRLAITIIEKLHLKPSETAL